MPTGYTYGIEDGIINSGSEFILRCARGFGACISMKEKSLNEAIPEKFEPFSYFIESLKKAENNLKIFKDMKIEDAKLKFNEEYESKIIDLRNSLEKAHKIKESYEKVKKEVDEWVPPSDDHIELKEFALDQIRISTEYSSIEWLGEELKRGKPKFEYWYVEKIEMLERDIEYSKKNLINEIERCDKCNEWVKKLRDSFKKDDNNEATKENNSYDNKEINNEGNKEDSKENNNEDSKETSNEDGNKDENKDENKEANK